MAVKPRAKTTAALPSVSASVNKKVLSRERSIEVILAEALKLFVLRGYAHSTVEDIAAACGVTKGAVYHYYGNKEDLLLALLDKIQSEAISNQPMLARRPEEPAALWIDRYINTQAMNAKLMPDAYLLVVVLSTDMSNSRRVGERIDAIFSNLCEEFETIVRVGQKSGEFTKELLAKELGLLWLAAFSGNVLQWHRSGRDEAIGRALVHGLRLALGRALTSHLDHPSRKKPA
jgi:AcrR family transcriptional regulator